MNPSDPPNAPTTHHLGDLQLAIMHVLWDHEEATVAQVHQALAEDRGLALTTIATMLNKMEVKGVVTHRTEGRRFVYRPVISERDVRRAMLGDLTDRLFAGDVTAVVSHLLAEREVDPQELSQLRAMIERFDREENGRD
ncbi:MAG: BlaI/MecI/CopY family transcriptional regulator [Acidobacteriota bacterium]